MPLVVKDRVKVSSTSTGTGTFTLGSAYTGYQDFSVIGNGNTTYYTITDGTNWEVGIGTYTASGTTLSRDTVLESSNAGALVPFPVGIKEVFVTYPAEKSVYMDANNDVSGYNIENSPIGSLTPAAGTFTTLTATGQTSLGGAAGSESLRVITPTGGGGNYWQLEGSNGDVAARFLGSSSNIGATFVTRGSGNYNFATGTSTSTVQARISHTASAVNYVQVTGAATTKNVIQSAQGSDTNIGYAIQPKGTGAINLAPGSSGVNISNGNTVTAITRTATGSLYTSIPSVAISAPTTAGGVQATATCTMFVSAVSLVFGGTGYTLNDTLTISGGTFASAATLTVTSVSSGVITGVSIANGGSNYSVLPTNPVSVTGGTGSGATFNITSWSVSLGFTITNAGSGYVEQPTVTFSGGGGSGAAAYATVGSGTTIRSLGSALNFVTPTGGTAFSIINTDASGAAYWSAIPGTGTPILSAIGTSSGQIRTVSAVPIQFVTGGVSSEQLRIAHTASAVNYVQVTGAATTARPVISAQGSDSNISFDLNAKGAAAIRLQSGSANIFRLNGVASAVNFFDVYQSATTKTPYIQATGTDSNVPFTILTTGTGAINLAPGSSGVNISNGGTVTAITRTAAGSGYTSPPTVAITAPTTAGGVQATATVTVGVNAFTIAGGGTGYTVGDTITLSGGTGTAATATVSTVSAGVITAISFTNIGSYSVVPSNPVSVTGGTGSGATLTISGYAITTNFTITNAGSGYVEQPTVTFSGGGGSGAAAYASVGSTPVIRSLVGTFSFNTSAGEGLRINNSGFTTLTDYIEVQGGGNVAGAYIGVNGSTTNSNLYLSAKGTGSLNFFTNGQGNVRQFVVSHTASAVNYVQVTGAATGGAPAISAQGSDTNIGLFYNSKGFSGTHRFQLGGAEALRIEQFGSTGVVNRFSMFANTSGGTPLLSTRGSDTNVGFDFSSQGTGAYRFYTNTASNGTGVVQFGITHTASAVNNLNATGAIASSGPVLSSVGTDTNIDLNLTTKGTGVVNLNTGAGTQVRIIDSGGTAVNRIHLQGQATGFLPVIASRGSDTNLGMSYSTQGTGPHDFYTAGTSFTQQFRVSHTASAVNYVQVTGSATGSGPILSAQGSDTNIPLVLQPKGTGALQAQQTDSTATGGNARGANAVDWQTSRGNAARVASATYSTIGGGNGNGAISYASIVCGGESNQANANYAFVGGGGGNTSSGIYSVTAGGQSNTAGGYHNFIGGGQLNSGTSGTAVTTQATTTVTSGSTAVTLSGSNANIRVGQLITGTGIVAQTYVAAISGTSLTLSQNANASGSPTLSFFTPHGVVVGGGNNQATGAYSFIGGGGDAGTAANRNVASGDWSFVGGGMRNTASGLGSVVVGGGTWDGTPNANTASGTASVICGGYSNTATSFSSAVIGGVSNSANGQASTIVGGVTGISRGIVGYTVFPACNGAINFTQGTHQSALLILARQTTDATPTVLASNSSAAGTTNQVILPNNSAYYFKGSVIANVTGAANGAAWSIEGAIMRGANAASTVLIGTPAVNRISASAGATAWTVAITADTTNGGIAITVTGAAATTIRWVARMDTTEVTF